MKSQQLKIGSIQKPKEIINDIRNYLAGRLVGITRDEGSLEEVLKILFILKNIDLNLLSKNEVDNAIIIREKFSEIKKKFPEFYSNNEEILIDPNSLNYVANSIKDILKKDQHIDLVGDFYEIFIGEHIKGKEGQFFTPKVAVDFLIQATNPNTNWKIIDTACGSCGFLSGLYTHFLNKGKSNNLLKKFVENNLYGIEKDKQLARLGRIHLSLINNTHANIAMGDSLSMEGDKLLNKISNQKFDLVITNPPFGSKIKSTNSDTRQRYQLGYKWKQQEDGSFIKTKELLKNVPPQVIFMERNINILKDNGILATVVPESLLTGKNYKYVVNYILQNTSIKAVVGMPESLFKTSGKSGTHTKTALLILQKKNKKTSYNFFMAEAKWCGHDSRRNPIPHNDIPKILTNYNKFRNNKLVANTLGYPLNSSKIHDYILAPKYYDIGFKNLQDKLSKKFIFRKISELLNNNVLTINTGDEVGKLAYGTGNIPFIRTSDLANWEIKADPKQTISREIYEELKEKQDIKKRDILMVKDGSYLIGTVAMVTELDEAMVYQSHIYKIRVLNNELGLDSYNLLGLLSSNFVQRQIQSKKLTQDIIDSLGKRIHDLVIPFPKDKNKLKKISKLVSRMIELKRQSKKIQTTTLGYTNSELS